MTKMILVSMCTWAVSVCVCVSALSSSYHIMCLPINFLEGEETFSLHSLSKLASYAVLLGGRGVIGIEDGVQRHRFFCMLMV